MSLQNFINTPYTHTLKCIFYFRSYRRPSSPRSRTNLPPQRSPAPEEWYFIPVDLILTITVLILVNKFRQSFRIYINVKVRHFVLLNIFVTSLIRANREGFKRVIKSKREKRRVYNRYVCRSPLTVPSLSLSYTLFTVGDKSEQDVLPQPHSSLLI